MLLALDYSLSQWFFAAGRLWPVWLVAGLATYLIWLLVFYTIFMGPRRGLIRAVAAASGALLFNLLITWFYFRARPFVELDFQPIIDLSPWSKSFPSDHATIAWSLFGSFLWQYKKPGQWWLPGALAVLISLGRVLAGVHYLSDVMAGAVIGLAASYVAFKIIAVAKEKQ